MYEILEDNSKHKKLKKDLNLLKEGQLQRFIRNLEYYKYLKCEFFRILLKHVSDHLSGLFQFA